MQRDRKKIWIELEYVTEDQAVSMLKNLNRYNISGVNYFENGAVKMKVEFLNLTKEKLKKEPEIREINGTLYKVYQSKMNNE